MDKNASIVGLLNRIREKFGASLGIADFEVRIRNDFRNLSPEANSYAIRIPEQYIEHLDKLSELIFSNKNLFTGVGDVSRETLDVEQFKISSKILTFNDFLKANNLEDASIQLSPNDNNRLEFSRVISALMLTFSMFHELGHVRQLNFNADNGQVIGENEEPENDLEECQVAEIDADIFAANFMGFYIYWALSTNSVPLGLTKKQFVHAVVYSLLLLFYLSNNDDDIKSKKRHPHPLVRISVIANFVENLWIKNNFVDSKEEFGSLIRCAIADLDNTINSLFGKGVDYRLKFTDDNLRNELDRFTELVQKYPQLNLNRPYKLDYVDRELDKDNL